MENVIDDIRYDEKTDEFSLVFKGHAKFDDFLKRIMYLTEVANNVSSNRK